MFPELANILDHDSSGDGPAMEEILLGSNEASGNFLVHHFISQSVKNQIPVILFSLKNSFNHYSSIASKLGNNLPQIRDKEFIFVDCMKVLSTSQHQTCSDNANIFNGRSCDMQIFYSFIKEQIIQQNTKGAPFVVICDDLTTLVNLGASHSDIHGFLLYLRSTCRDSHCTKLIYAVDDFSSIGDKACQDDDVMFVWKSLCYTSDVILKCQALSTGYCRDVHGELQIRFRNKLGISKDIFKKYQYRIQDKTVNFFAVGTSSAVL